ncbi:hypothetical protein [Bacillus cereus]
MRCYIIAAWIEHVYNMFSATSMPSKDRTCSIWFAIVTEAEPANNKPMATPSFVVIKEPESPPEERLVVTI